MQWLRDLRTATLAAWIAVLAAPIAAQLFLSRTTTAIWVAPSVLFAVVLVAASLCVVTSCLVLRLAHAEDVAETGIVATFFFTVSVLPLVHGITTPGVLYGPNTATMSAVFWAPVIAVVGGMPVLVGSTSGARRLLAHWRRLASVQIGVVLALAATLLILPDVVPMPTPGSPTMLMVCALIIACCVLHSLRHLRLALIAGREGPAWVGLGFGLVGGSTLVFAGAMPYSAGFWYAHALDIAGVLASTIAALTAYRSRGSVRAVLAPLAAAEPIAALELGLDPVVRRFVADLDAKDPITRDHVVRTAALAIAVGDRMGFTPDRLAVLGVGALLHDVGKLEIPDHILAKPGRLTDAEFAVIREHPTIGSRLLASAGPNLAAAVPAVLQHHERIDGRGYPRGLRGDQISIEARVVAACDAFDAMANTRQYRAGMGADRAIAVLREHQGAQWDSDMIDALVTTVTAPGWSSRSMLDHVGRPGDGIDAPAPAMVGCDCGLPEPPTLRTVLAGQH